VYGGEEPVIGPLIFQPLSLSASYRESESRALSNGGVTIHRPVLLLRDGIYDSWIAAALEAAASEAPYSTGDVARPISPECTSNPESPSCNGGTTVGMYDDAGNLGYMNECEFASSTGQFNPFCVADGHLQGWFPYVLDGNGPSAPPGPPAPNPPNPDRQCYDLTCEPYCEATQFSCHACHTCRSTCIVNGGIACRYSHPSDLTQCITEYYNECMDKKIWIFPSCNDVCDCNATGDRIPIKPDCPPRMGRSSSFGED
jgi:hypothetical protein